MYQPAHFAHHDPDALLPLMRAYPLAMLVRAGAAPGAAPDGDAFPFQADAIPFEVEHDPTTGWRITGHVARANPLWREAEGAEVLLVFQGAQAYVSPSWYASKAEHGKVVPTWNYAVVQVRGRLRVHDDADWLRDFLPRLTQRHEGPRAQPWHVDDAPADYLAATMRAIVGIEVEVLGVEGKFKLSQNRAPADRAGVREGLAADAAEGRQPGAAATSRSMSDLEAGPPPKA